MTRTFKAVATAILAVAISAPTLLPAQAASSATTATNTLSQITSFTIKNTLLTPYVLTVDKAKNTITATYTAENTVVDTYNYGTRVSDTAAANQVTKTRAKVNAADAFCYKYESTGSPVTANTKTNQFEAKKTVNGKTTVIARFSYNFGMTDAQAVDLAGHYPD